MSLRSFAGQLVRLGTLVCALGWIDHKRCESAKEIGRRSNPLDVLDQQQTVTIAVHNPKEDDQ